MLMDSLIEISGWLRLFSRRNSKDGVDDGGGGTGDVTSGL